MKLNRVVADGFLSSHNNPIGSSYQVPIVIIDNGNRELYLLATLEYSGVIILPLPSSPILNCVHQSTKDISNHSCIIPLPLLDLLAASVT